MPMKLDPTVLHKIQKLSHEHYPHLQALRCKLHQYPELSGEESWTAALLSEELRDLNLQIRTDVAGHGLIVDLVTDVTKPTVTLRVDMDALPIDETNTVPYRSKVPGVSHACGHDVHSAVGVGVAMVLKHLGNSVPGNVRIIFQPEEEEITGALKMIEEGALENPQPAAILGCHVAPIPVGQVAWTDGLFLAGFDHYLGTILPPEGMKLPVEQLDALAEQCCQAVESLNQWHLPETWEDMQVFWKKMREGPQDLQSFIIYDASTDEEDPASWHGQFAVGVKAADQDRRQFARQHIIDTINPICRAAGSEVLLDLWGSMPDMVNNSLLVRSTLPSLAEAISPENAIRLKAAFPFNCEDFAYYTQIIPGAMYWLGGADPSRGKFAMLHTSDFDVDERCLVTGTIAMTTLLLESLNNQFMEN